MLFGLFRRRFLGSYLLVLVDLLVLSDFLAIGLGLQGYLH